LVLLLGGHLVVCRFGNSEDVGRHLEPVLAPVRLQRLLGVDAEVCTSAIGRLQPVMASELDPPRKGLTEMST
jgi:purine nucleoside phosphorylase